MPSPTEGLGSLAQGARGRSHWDTVTSRTWTYATWTSVGSPSTSCWNRMALERPEPRTPGGVDTGLIWKPRTTPSKGASSGSRQLCQSSLRVPSPVYSDARLPFGPPSRRTTTQSAASASGTWSSAPSGCSEHWNRAATGGWIVIASIVSDCAAVGGGRRTQGQRQEYGRDSEGVECFPVHRLHMETGGTEGARKRRRFTAEFKGRVALEALRERDSGSDSVSP